MRRHVSAVAETALALAHAGEPSRADVLLTRAIETDAENGFLRGARGVIRRNWKLGRDHDDLERAVAANTKLVFPYLFLAEDALRSDDPLRSFDLCNRALEQTSHQELTDRIEAIRALALQRLQSQSELSKDELKLTAKPLSPASFGEIPFAPAA